MIDTDKYPDGPDDERLMHFSKEELRLIVWAYGCEIRNLKHASTHTDAYTLAEVKRLHKNKSNLFTTIEQKLNEKGDEGEAIWEANPDGHYKEDELRGWCEALEFVLSLMKAQEREE